MNKPLLACVTLLVSGLATVPGGCAGASKPGGDTPKPLLPPERVPIFRADGSRADFDAVVSSCAEAQAVLIGEVHGHPQGLDFAAAVWEGVLSRTDEAALSMEFFERDQQVGLDDYLDGVTDEAAFKKATARSAGSYPPGHRRMVEAAKAAHRPVIAANAPRRYVRLARTDSMERLAMLTPEQRRLFDTPDTPPSEAYHQRFVTLRTGMGSDPTHGAPANSPPPDPEEERKTIEGFYRAQVVWDATMAASIDRALDKVLSPVVHVVGGFHIADDGGTLQLLRNRRPDTKIVTIALVDADASSLRPEDKGKADYIVYVGPLPDDSAE
jgi:uncharacterized iron-regulated protein